LTPVGIALGSVGPVRADAYATKAAALARGRELLERLALTPTEAGRLGLEINRDGRRRSAFELLAYPGIDLARLVQIWPEIRSLAPKVAQQLEVDARYAAYVDRQAADVAALKRDEAAGIPGDFDYAAIPGLSNEVRQKLERQRPASLAQAAAIDGMTPAALLLVRAHLKRKKAAKAVQG
jgi:tRNA uridine 5-carboxymethylaminomethyl modification enzyme